MGGITASHGLVGQFAVAPKGDIAAQRYVGHKIRQAIIRKAKYIDKEALEWCLDGMTPWQRDVYGQWRIDGGKLV